MYLIEKENPQVSLFPIFVFQFILIFLDLFWILDFKHFDLSLRLIYFISCNPILKLRHVTL